MDFIKKTLSNTNKDCEFTKKINKSKYCESNSITEMKKYNNFLYCIIDNFNLVLSNSNDKKLEFNKIVTDICSKLDEETNLYYDKFNYSSRFSIKKIQHSLQSCLRDEKFISSIYYLNDFYSNHIVIVDIKNKTYYETSFKNYPKKYLFCDGNTFSFDDKLDSKYTETKENIVFDDDFSKNIYNNYLKAIGNYKLEDLKNICNSLNISYMDGNKVMKKKNIYDMINLHKLNLI